MDHNYFNLLIDYYGSLITKHQRSILEDYFFDDLSMSEIAENRKISKSAVSDIINRSTKQLEEFEKQLHLVKDIDRINSVLDEMNNSNNKELEKYAKKIEKIIRG